MMDMPDASENARILIVASEDEARRKLCGALAAAGFESLVAAHDLDSAETALVAERPDLVMVHVRRGDFSDEELFRDIERLPRERFVAVLIADSQAPMNEIVERARVIPAARLIYRQLNDEKIRVEFEAQQCASRYEEAIAVLKKTEQRLAADLTKSEAQSMAKSEFIANLSHELRTPLNAIIGFSDIMSNESLGPIGSSKYKEYSTDIHKAGNHLLTLINDILDMSRAESGQMHVHLEPVDVRDTINGAARMFQERARRKGVTLKTEIAPDFPKLRTDERRLRQVLINVIGNAVKFTAAGGLVVVKGGVDPQDGAFLIVISDNGIGIDAADLPMVMSRYGQVRDSQADREPGSGIGLPLTQKIVEALGGKFELRSQRKVGTAVTLRFPPDLIVRGEAETSAPLKARAS